MIMEIDKQNGSICFNEEAHVYFDKSDENDRYVSVTTLIHSFTQPFDKDFWSAYKALEKLIPKEYWSVEKKSLLNTKKFDKEILSVYNISENSFNKTQQDILDEWDKKNKDSCERGTKIHSELENQYYKKPKNISLQKYGIGGKFECKKGYTPLDMECGIYPEYLIYRKSDDGVLKIAGQIDLLVKNGNDIWILDYKGLPLDTKIPTINGWSTMGELKEGDTIFDKDGNPTKIIHKSSIHTNPCYKITFDNGDSIVADHEHRWLISFKRKYVPKGQTDPYTSTVMTTEEIASYLEDINNNGKKNSYTIPKILNPKPLNLEDSKLPIDPYVLGVWLGDGSKACGMITQAKGSPVWDEIRRRGYEIGENAQHNPDRENTEMRTVYGLRTLLNSLGLINKKFIPDIYQRASYRQRLDLLRGLMDTDGYYHPARKRYVMSTGQEWQRDDMIKLLSSLGVKVTVFDVIKKCNGKQFQAWDVCFSTSDFNPFLVRNQDIDLGALKSDKRTFRNIVSVEKVETVPTQCIEVDSPTHTFLCTEKMIVTHNTNQSIDMKSGFDTKTKKNATMQYPLNNLQDCNYYHYTLQLSTYAWMIQKLNPNFNIKGLILVHYGHDGNVTQYKLDYLKSDVERMLAYHKKEVIKQKQREKRKRIEY